MGHEPQRTRSSTFISPQPWMGSCQVAEAVWRFSRVLEVVAGLVGSSGAAALGGSRKRHKAWNFAAWLSTLSRTISHRLAGDRQHQWVAT